MRLHAAHAAPAVLSVHARLEYRPNPDRQHRVSTEAVCVVDCVRPFDVAMQISPAQNYPRGMAPASLAPVRRAELQFPEFKIFAGEFAQAELTITNEQPEPVRIHRVEVREAREEMGGWNRVPPWCTLKCFEPATRSWLLSSRMW